MSTRLDIVSIGMVTAVGLDAPSACAAMRARLDGFRQTRLLGSAGEWQTGAPIALPRNWIGDRRMAHMAAGAVCEAFEGVPEARGQTALILCLPEEDRPGRVVRDNSGLLRSIAQIAEIELHPSSRIIAHGRPSGIVALDHARRLLASGDLPFVMIAGVDSYLTSQTVAHYLSQNRILTPQNPNGFLPGEAAAAVICTQRRQTGMRLFGLGLSRENASIYNAEDLPLRGDGMTAAYRSAFEETGIEMNRLGYRIADLVGEQYWFKQSSLASLRLLRGRHEFQDIWSPGESLGNVGAAVVPLMLGMAFTAARKGYAAGNPVLIEASNDAGACGAAIVASRAA
ncbi:3-oxoacyl-ACP synthase [Mesorhizobium hawassense]|uniref:3-oxoacyl-ACP synthase n=1 Tax=Mesorhizobium hawassense TaxID=1209954 RepID=A0A330HY59_9HYPH|nr:3-oxoacyl-ACP synthase [Mesorhizobium hawassense]RAZ92490.1 3-oxoacyl-ACP synthase [Mesorhizobium hawassense]